MTPGAAERLEALCHGEHIGTLQRHRGQLSFTYLDAWRRRDDATPLSLSMPLAARHHPQRVVEPFLWGLLPDNDAVLTRWGREFAVSSAHPFGLLAHVGEDLPGAMQLVRPDRVDELSRATGPASVTWLGTNDVAEMLRSVRRDHTAWFTHRAEGRWSLAGAQPKIALLCDGDRWGRPAGRTPTTHILKPAVVGLDDHDLNEHLCLRAASRLGLRVALSRIETFDDERAIVVARYDRVRRADGSWQRVHQEDVCQALGFHPTAKYQSDGGPSPSDVVRLLRTTMRHDRAAEAVAAFADALAFNWLIAGPDAHAKNYAVLLAGPQVRLAPFYDIGSALAYPEFHPPKVKLAMKIGGYYRLSAVGRSAWARLAGDLGIDQDLLLGRISQLAATVTDAFTDAANHDDVVSLRSPLPARLVDAVAIRAADCRRSLS